MRKPHNRWTVLAGAAAVSLAAFGFPALAAATEDASPSAHTVHHRSAYLVDGYRVGYLPPGLDQYASASETPSNGGGDRASHLAWTQNGTVYGRVDVRRHADPLSLAEVRDTYHGHLKAPRRTTVNGHPAYLSAADGEVFWVDEQGTALSVFLKPDRWSSDELMEMAAGIVRQENAESTVSVVRKANHSALDFMRGEGAERSHGPEAESTGSAQATEEEQPRLLPADADAPASPSSGGSGGLSEKQATEVMVCLTEEADMPREEVPTESGVTTPWGSATWNSGLWELVPVPTRESAVVECARRTGLDRTQVQEAADGSADSSSGGDSSSEGADRSSADSGESAEQNEESEQQSLWDLLPWK